MIHDTTKAVRMLLHNFIFSLNCIVVPRRLQIGLLELRRFLECDNKSRWRTRRDRRKEERGERKLFLVLFRLCLRSAVAKCADGGHAHFPSVSMVSIVTM